MALVVADRVKETTTSTGTGTIDLAGAVSGFQTFVAGVGDTNTTYYAIIDPAGATWEVGIGTVTDSTPDTLSRDTIIASSNSGSAVSFGAGNKNVFSTQPADKAVYLDSSGQLVIGGVAVTSTAAELNYVDGVTSNIQTQLDAKVDLSGDTMTGALTLSGAPTADLHATTKLYVDELIAAGIHYHDPVRVESPDSAGNLNATYDNGTSGVGATLTNNGTQAALVIDGVTLATSDRVLIYNQTNAFENGIYTVTNTGSVSTNWVLTRATDADSYGVDNQSLSEGTSVFVLEGDDGSGEVYACTTTGTITFGTTAINFSQIGRSAVITGNGGITVTGNEISANVNATVQTTGANSVSSTASRTYAVQPDSSDNLVVNVPWTDTTTNQTITLSGDATGSGTTSISVSLATDSVGSNEIAANAVGASELNVSGNGTTTQFLRSDGDGTFTWATPTDTNTTYSAGSGLSLTGTTFANTAPDQTVSLTGSGATTVTGTYPNFTISSTDTDTNTTYSVATSGTLGLVKIGYSENGKNYPVELSSGQMYVNVPWVDTNTTYSVGDGGLTQVNFTTARRDKLNGIESGATADQTASEILTAIKTVDGSGSGLDADTIDGIQGASFLRSDANDTATGDLTFNGKITAADPDFANQLEVYRSGGAQYSMIKYTNTGGELGKIGFSDTGVALIRLGTSTANNTIWHSGNDGSGSGLDADNLDGLTWTSSGKNVRATEFYADNWFRNYNAGEGLYNEATGAHWVSDADGYWTARDAANHIGIQLKTNGTTLRGYVYANNSNEIGFLDAGGSWAIKHSNDNGTYFYTDSTTEEFKVGRDTVTGNYGTVQVSSNKGGWGGYSIFGAWVFMANGDANCGIYNDSDNEWSLYATRNGSTELRANGVHEISAQAGYGYAPNSMRSPLFYDYNDTGYYVDPAGTSIVNDFRVDIMYDKDNTSYYARPGSTSKFNDLRANIFYDNNNTGYFVDPASTSRFNVLEADGIHAKDRGDYFTFYGGNDTNHSISSRNSAGAADDDLRINSYGAVYINLDSNNNNTNVADFRIGRHGGTGSIAQLGLFDVYGDSLYVYSAYSFRSPIFYDSNDTNYYVNPASTSVMNAIYLADAIYHKDDTNTGIQFSANDTVRIFTGSVERFKVTTTALTTTVPITSSGDITAFSDIRLKENVETIDNALDKVQSLRGVTYTKDGKDGLGVIAQEVEEVIPQVVLTADDEIGTKSVAYGNIVGLLIEAVKEQQKQIDALKNEITALKGFE